MWSKQDKKKAVDYVLKRVSEGESVRAVFREPKGQKLPAPSTFELWVKDPEISVQYARAVELRAEVKFESIEADYMEEPQRDSETGKIDTGWVQLQRLKIDAKKWELSKMLPKKYGDSKSIDHTTDGEKITFNIGLTNENE